MQVRCFGILDRLREGVEDLKKGVADAVEQNEELKKSVSLSCLSTPTIARCPSWPVHVMHVAVAVAVVCGCAGTLCLLRHRLKN